MGIAWSKIRNQDFGEDKESIAARNGEVIGYVDKYRYSRFAHWEGLCALCGHRFEEGFDAVKEAQQFMEQHFTECNS